MERRTEKRVPYRTEAKIDGMGTAFSSIRVCDLSVSGAFVETTAPIPEKTMVEVEFDVGGKSIRVSAEVCYVEPRIGMGIRFVELPEPARQAILSLTAQD